MHNQLKAAIMVEAAVLLVAFAFSIAYFVMGWYRSSHVLDVILVVLWILVAGVLLVVFRQRSIVREEMVRRFYLSHDWIYNHEIGYAPISKIMPDRDVYEFVTFAAESLARMSYGFEVALAPDDFNPELVISTKQFRFRLIDDEGGPADDSVVIDEWTGTLQRVIETDATPRFEEIGAYSNAKELSRLLLNTGIIESSNGAYEGDRDISVMSLESLLS